ncbi:MAG: hypothetical protein ABGW77_03460 [Campylobacterales bacterium]
MTDKGWSHLSRGLLLLYFPLLYWYGVSHLSIAPFEIGEVSENPLLLNWYRGALQLTSSLQWGDPTPLLRGIPLLLSWTSALLLSQILPHYIRTPREQFYTLLLYLLLPGTVLSTLLLTRAALLLLETTLLLYLFHRGQPLPILLLPVVTLLDPANISLGIGAIIYGLWHRNWKWIGVGLAGMAEVFLLLGYRIGGVPKGHFLHFLLVYSSIYSPLLFLYFLYALYKENLPGYRSLIGSIASGAFLLSLLLSFRQKIKIEEFAPFTLPFLIPIARHFLNSYRVRLKPFRRGYRLLLTSILISILGFDGVLLINPLKDKLGSGLYFTRPVARRLPILLQRAHISSQSDPQLLEALLLYYHPSSPEMCEVIWRKKVQLLEFNCSNRVKTLSLSPFLK